MAYPDRQPILGQTVLPKGRELYKQVDLIEKQGGEALLETREHVFVKLRWRADRTGSRCKDSCSVARLCSAAHGDDPRCGQGVRVAVAVLARLTPTQPEVEVAP